MFPVSRVDVPSLARASLTGLEPHPLQPKRAQAPYSPRCALPPLQQGHFVPVRRPFLALKDQFGKALILMHKFSEHSFSMTDCMSFVMMKELKIKEAFSTDKHFSIAGFSNLLLK